MPIAMPKIQNLGRVWDTKQDKDESPIAYLERVKTNMRKYGGLDPEAKENSKLLNLAFIGGAWDDIRKKVQKDENWENKDIQDLLTVAQKVYVNRDQEKVKEKARVMSQFAKQPDRNDDGNKNSRWNKRKGGDSNGIQITQTDRFRESRGRWVPIGRDECHLCFRRGHWKDTCPLREKRQGPAGPTLDSGTQNRNAQNRNTQD